MHTTLLRHQHHEIIAIVNDMRKHLLAPQRMSTATAESLSESLGQLAARLTSHLAIEDKGLYPKLQVPNGTPTSRVAVQFSHDMVAIVQRFREFHVRWPSGEVIHAEKLRFVDECTTVFHDLTHRIEREEKELYPMADAHP